MKTWIVHWGPNNNEKKIALPRAEANFRIEKKSKWQPKIIGRALILPVPQIVNNYIEKFGPQ